jgi:hypothetical protein
MVLKYSIMVFSFEIMVFYFSILVFEMVNQKTALAEVTLSYVCKL